MSITLVSVYPDHTTIHDCRYVTVALAIAHYYWTRGNRDVMPRFPVLHAARTTLRCSIFSTYQTTCFLSYKEISMLQLPICTWQQQLSSFLHRVMSVIISQFCAARDLSHCHPHHFHHHQHHQSRTYVHGFVTSQLCAECLAQTPLAACVAANPVLRRQPSMTCCSTHLVTGVCHGFCFWIT